MTERDDPRRRAPFAPAWTVDELITEGLAALERGEAGDGKRIDGRALAVKASPIKANSEHIVVGTATLPPGFSTRPHSHEAEEVAVVLQGGGSVEIEGVEHRLDRGTILLTPANLVHVTHSDPGSEPLVILWFYAPPGAEARWVEPDKYNTAGHFSGSAADVLR
jgi:quercetin dioxygenase-like cupin family protein